MCVGFILFKFIKKYNLLILIWKFLYEARY